MAPTSVNVQKSRTARTTWYFLIPSLRVTLWQHLGNRNIGPNNDKTSFKIHSPQKHEQTTKYWIRNTKYGTHNTELKIQNTHLNCLIYEETTYKIRTLTSKYSYTTHNTSIQQYTFTHSVSYRYINDLLINAYRTYWIDTY